MKRIKENLKESTEMISDSSPLSSITESYVSFIKDYNVIKPI